MNNYTIFVFLVFTLNAQPGYRDYVREVNALCQEVGGIHEVPDARIHGAALLLSGIVREYGYSYVQDFSWLVWDEPGQDGVRHHLAQIIQHGHHLPVKVMGELLSELKSCPQARGFIAVRNKDYPVRRINEYEIGEILGVCEKNREKVSGSESLQLFEAELRKMQAQYGQDAVAEKTTLVAARLGLAPK